MRTPAKILLVEDSESDAFLTREALKGSGLEFELRVLADGEEAIRLVDTIDGDMALDCPELILLDLNLPKRSGDQVLRHIRTSNRCKNVPVLIVTSSEAPRDRKDTAGLGATGYFHKPSSFTGFMTLGPLVRSVLKKP